MSEDLTRQTTSDNSDLTGLDLPNNAESEPVKQGESDQQSDEFKNSDDQSKLREAKKSIKEKSLELAETKKQLDMMQALLTTFGFKSDINPAEAGSQSLKKSHSEEQCNDMGSAGSLNKEVEWISANQQNDGLDKAKNLEIAGIEQKFIDNLQKIALAAKQGRITTHQARALANNLREAKAQEKAKIFSKYELYGREIAEKVNSKILQDFNKSNQNFLDIPERQEVIDYMKKSCDILDPHQLNKVAELVKKIEDSAIVRFQSQTELQNQNDKAKTRLTSAADSGLPGSGEYQKIFTRQEIGKMGKGDFAKNETAIFEQMKKGLIR